MLILTIRTDKPEAEIGLYNDAENVASETWQAHRLLAETIHQKIKELLQTHKCELSDLEGVAVFRGPGSFTGLRIGISVANALADSLSIPIVGTDGEEWSRTGCRALAAGRNDKQVMPEYGAPPHVTAPKH